MGSVNNVISNPVPSDTDVIKSFAKNAEVRQNNFSMVDFATTCILDGSSVVSKSTGSPVDYKEIVSTFNQLCVKTNNVQRAIENGHKLTPSLMNAHRELQTGLNSISVRVLEAALKTGVIEQPKTAAPVSRMPTVGTMVAGTMGVLGTAAAAGGYIYECELREAYRDNIPQEHREFVRANLLNPVSDFIENTVKPSMPPMPEFAVPAFIKDIEMPEFKVPEFITNNIPKSMPTMPTLTMPDLDTITDLFFTVDSTSSVGFTMTPAQMGATAGAVAVGAGIVYTGIKYRKQIGSGIATVANIVATVAVAPFKMCASAFHRG